MGSNSSLPALLDPPNDIPAQAQGIRSIQEALMCPLEHIALVDEVIQHLSPLHDKRVDLVLSVPEECMFTKCMVFSQYGCWPK